MLFEFKKISSSLNYERANRIGELLSKNKIAYQLKPRVMSVYNIFDSAHRCPAKADRTAVFFLRASMRQNKNISKPEMH